MNLLIIDFCITPSPPTRRLAVFGRRQLAATAKYPPPPHFLTKAFIHATKRPIRTRINWPEPVYNICHDHLRLRSEMIMTTVVFCELVNTGFEFGG